MRNDLRELRVFISVRAQSEMVDLEVLEVVAAIAKTALVNLKVLYFCGGSEDRKRVEILWHV